MLNAKELEIRNLVVSFRTNKGIVHAVRGINLTLEKGETLAIVGESGSGKSVSAKAILGIEAPNAIIEDGEVLYHGQNLLTFSEEEFNRIRGNKITMVFQDPMSSLDPIVKIGTQMTEASILNGKTNQKLAKKELNDNLKNLSKALLAAGITADKVKSEIATFKKFIACGSKLLTAYNNACEYADSIVFDIKQILIDLHDEDNNPIQEEIKNLLKKMEQVYNPYFVNSEKCKCFGESRANLLNLCNEYKPKTASADKIAELLNKISSFLSEKLSEEKPNFFTLGYYVMSRGKDDLDWDNVADTNKKTREIVDKEFMIAFRDDIAAAIKEERDRSIRATAEAFKEADKAKKIFGDGEWNTKECKDEIKKLCALVDTAVNRLALSVDRAIYTLKNTLNTALEHYKTTPAYARKNAQSALKDLCDLYNHTLEVGVQEDLRELGAAAIAIIDRYKELSNDAAYHVTKQMAYDKAIQIMEEVGIRDPRKRFNQYPFEFSGGMRQRIVIAIAIAANPDLLICDEPTTALDVTIQAQILELINKLKQKRNMSVIFITHDLGVVANVADKIAVMYAGKVVEKGTAEDIFYSPAHPYTWALLASMPDLDTKDSLEAIPGTPPNMIYPPKGDAFAARNQYAMEIDFEEEPPMFQISDTHSAATWLLHPNAPKIEIPESVSARIKRMKEKEEERKNAE